MANLSWASIALTATARHTFLPLCPGPRVRENATGSWTVVVKKILVAGVGVLYQTHRGYRWLGEGACVGSDYKSEYEGLAERRYSRLLHGRPCRSHGPTPRSRASPRMSRCLFEMVLAFSPQSTYQPEGRERMDLGPAFRCFGKKSPSSEEGTKNETTN